jgi:hypothetical protein
MVSMTAALTRYLLEDRQTLINTPPADQHGSCSGWVAML